jgi:dUTP pyrophosphatase
MELKVKKLDPEAKLPSYAHDWDAGMDLYSNETVVIPAGEVRKIKSGISIEIPEGYVGLCWDKSGLSMNNSIKSLGGVIDAGYRGEITFGMINLGKESYTFEKGHKVVQMLVQKVEHMDIKEVNDLSDTSRGVGGFGSTGK